jgi:HAD superfamily hydrolase (TIGR01549 family)
VKRLVLLDWGGTLCGHTGFVAMVESAAARIGRAVDGAAMMQALIDADYSDPMRDSSPDAAIAANVEELRLAGFDDEELARAICARECDPDVMVAFPDARPFLEAVRDADIRRVVVSNCGYDIRRNLRAHGLDELIDDYVLSCEHGIVKPDPRLFEIALGDTDPADALMVGDSAADAGAIKAGIETILLPEARSPHDPRGFGVVLSALGR